MPFAFLISAAKALLVASGLARFWFLEKIEDGRTAISRAKSERRCGMVDGRMVRGPLDDWGENVALTRSWIMGYRQMLTRRARLPQAAFPAVCSCRSLSRGRELTPEHRPVAK